MRGVAAYQLKTERLQRWWCKKYNRPRKDPLLGEYTIEELMVEYLEDAIEEDPQQALPRADHDSIAFHTGDPLIDRWEKDLAAGKEVDVEAEFMAAMSREDREKLERFVGKKRPVVEEFHDVYDKKE